MSALTCDLLNSSRTFASNKYRRKFRSSSVSVRLVAWEASWFDPKQAEKLRIELDSS
jgi:hypothetical protein